MADFRFETVDDTAVMIRPLTNRAATWLKRHVEYLGESDGYYLVKAASAPSIVAAAARDGLSVRNIRR